MQITIGKCSLCLIGNVIRETSLDVEDECEACGALRDNNLIDMYLPSATEPQRHHYGDLDGDALKRHSDLDYEDVYDVANH